MELAVLYYNILEDMLVLGAGKAFPPRPLPAGIFSEKVLRFSADTEKTYIPLAHILCKLYS